MNKFRELDHFRQKDTSLVKQPNNYEPASLPQFGGTFVV